MTDKRLTDNEIIKALMCFSFWHEGCEKCPYLKRCNKVKRMLTIIDTIDALALINRQQAEIERLQGYNENLQTANTYLSNEILEAKAEAIKEVAERLKEKASKTKIVYVADTTIQEQETGWYQISIDDLDNLVKEMVGEDK